MALVALHTAMHLEESKNVHPFFSKPSKVPDSEPTANDATTNHDDQHGDQDYGVQETSPKTSEPRKKRARRTAHTKNQPSLDSFARRAAVKSGDVDVKADGGELAGPSLEEDLNLDRRKRRKTASPAPEVKDIIIGRTAAGPPSDLYQQLHTEAGTTGTQEVTDGVMVDTLVAGTPKDEAPASSPPPIAEHVHEDVVPESSLPQAVEAQSRSTTPPNTVEHVGEPVDGITVPAAAESAAAKITPKKQIKVTKTGKLVSSPPKKPDPPISTPPKKRGRPRKASKKANLSATITIIRYGADDVSRLALGQKIDSILSGGKSSNKHVSIAPPKKSAGPPKAPHPFFTGKAGQKTAEASTKQDIERRPVGPKTSACTPGKLRAERRKEQDDEDTPAFGISSKNNRVAKQSGLHEPLWPLKGTAHVRNFDSESATKPFQQPSGTSLTLKPSKLKSSAYTLSTEEEIITKLTEQLSEVLKSRSHSSELEFAPPEDVRLPTRLLTTGIDIQHKVRTQIRAPIETLAQRLYAKTHPAITTLFDGIEHILTPFDEGRCESQAWAQKYRPKRAEHVLQPGTEAFALRDWLKSLTVMAVGAAQEPSKASAPLDAKKPPKKKRRTTVDDFIVSDDEEEDEEMVELGHDSSAAPRQYPSLRRPRWTRNKNVVLLSGPHGCGKSATVYAVAKELDFEVFELHSGIRRSGKDIQDKVGDMTANHLVNHQRGDLPVKAKPALAVAADDTDNERDKEFQKDLDSGRQGTMTSFFTAKPATKPQPKPVAKTQVTMRSPAKARSIPAAQAMLPIAASRKSQKQSLILIEEADILFEEDQNFWAQVIKLAAQSKRPIVITCNDELQIPTQALPMAAILRLTPPSVDLATDYLIALAGREGHILQRRAISDLYISRSHDLRASVTELNFWCQMSVGDKKGGLEWMYQRWPPGKDVDANGRLLRVASEDTYQSGMGWLSHNMIETTSNVVFDKEEELLLEAWNDWGISPDSWNTEDQPMNKTVESDKPTQSTHLNELDRLASFSDALSAADIYSRIDLPAYANMHDQPIDPTLPAVPDKERASYTTSAPLLQADPSTDFTHLATSLAVQTSLLTHRLRSHHAPPTSTSPTAKLLSHLSNPVPGPLTRTAFSALDPLATLPSPFPYPDTEQRTSYPLLYTSLDRPFRILTLDLAPYVRSIVACEQVREAQRVRLGLLCEGGRKRGRMTRASRCAVEGGERGVGRRERWFCRELRFGDVMRTAGAWAGLGWRGEGDGGEEASVEDEGSVAGTQDSARDGDVELLGADDVE